MPQTYVTDVAITPEVDTQSVDITVETNRAIDKIDVKIVDKSGKIVAHNASVLANSKTKLKIASPRLWSTTDPYLYDIHINAGNDSIVSYVGLRKIEVKKDRKGINRFHLNGKPIFMYAPLEQGYWPDSIYNAPTEEALINDFNVLRTIGFNSLRKHVKVERDRFYWTADRLGFLVWQDFPCAFGKVENDVRSDRNEAKQIELEMMRMVSQLRNFPSIVMWIPFNEGWGQYDSKRIVDSFRKWDPTRLINEASGWNDHKLTNIQDQHSYPTSKEIPLNPNRVIVNGEYGGAGLVVKDHLWDPNHLYQYQMMKDPKELEKFFLDRLATVRAHAMFGLGAAVYTQNSDTEREVNGLMTYDREVWKVDNISVVNEFVKKLYPLESVKDIVFPSGEH